MTYAVDELSYFINKLDSLNKHNKIDFCSRIHGLYIWDQKLLYDNTKSMPMIYKHFNNKFHEWSGDNENEEANIKYFHRVYNGTRKSIEEKSFCQLK